MSRSVTLEEAREILGEEAEGYTDDSLQELINDFEQLAGVIIRNFSVLKSNATGKLDLV